ncbi:GNAT family N-acetyltransferase [Streptomyces virginiae]|uniref:GNAT family N-acetyltransferase n=1 Tax=Streptomyces virginiae TaxID=1961 RepID=UPI0036BAEA5D
MASVDEPAVLELIDADWLPGQQQAHELLTPAGESPHTLVVCDPHGEVVGAVLCQVRTEDDAGLIVWLHGREDFEVIAALIALARAQLGNRVLYACTGPATATGIPGLPAGHRPVTARALTAAGFTQASRQRYFLRDLTDVPPAPPTYPLADATDLARPAGWRLELTGTDGQPLASGTLLAPAPATADMAVLSQLTVQCGQRRHGIGSHLLAQCLHRAHTNGASHVTAVIPEGDTAAARFLASAAFLLLDTLTVYHRRP